MSASVKQTRHGADMDMTIYKLTGEKLKEQIIKDVKGTQVLVGLHLPDKMLLTKAQFQSLEHDTQRLDDTQHRIYIIPGLCVMEVYVVDDGKTKLPGDLGK